jgi:hypothetical protein
LFQNTIDFIKFLELRAFFLTQFMISHLHWNFWGACVRTRAKNDSFVFFRIGPIVELF